MATYVQPIERSIVLNGTSFQELSQFSVLGTAALLFLSMSLSFSALVSREDASKI